METKQSSIEWLYKQLLNSEPNILEWNKLLQQAKEMHKQEIENAWKMGRYDSDKIVMSEKFYAEEFYNETFVAQK